MTRVRAMESGDWDAVAAIYREGIEMGLATFETSVPDRESWDRRHVREGRLVLEEDGCVVGWAALTRVSDREVYRGVAEVSVYLAGAARGRGLGRLLLRALVGAGEDAGFWTLQAGVFPENAASLAVHEACGFRRLGVRERPGALDGVWRDVVLLERRSRQVGTG